MPTSDEWRIAAEQSRAAEKGSNLRDIRWMRHLEHTVTLRTRLMPIVEKVPMPNERIFLPAGVGTDANKDAIVIDEDDGTLWLREVPPPDSKVMADLIGNVAEFVYEDPAVFEQTPLRLDVAKAGVIGGSGLSGPWWKPGEPSFGPVYPVDRHSFWCDVGFRLAFTARNGAGDLDRKLREIAYRPMMQP